MNDDRRLIEDYLPIGAISAEARREKSVRKGHISTLHLWWARRPLARAIESPGYRIDSGGRRGVCHSAARACGDFESDCGVDAISGARHCETRPLALPAVCRVRVEAIRLSVRGDCFAARRLHLLFAESRLAMTGGRKR